MNCQPEAGQNGEGWTLGRGHVQEGSGMEITDEKVSILFRVHQSFQNRANEGLCCHPNNLKGRCSP